jgi:S-methylmethionine-dependent homocysteine/selenocysteine methylase
MAMLTARRPLILDGAIGTELNRRGVDTGLPLWSAHAILTSPDTVLQIHGDYIAAGADIITTNTFRTTRRTFLHASLADHSDELTATATALARQARDSFPGRTVLIAGSVAPLEDCYRPDLVPDDNALHSEHGELAERLGRNGVDFLLLETMGTIREARIACAEAIATGLEVVVSFLCRGDGSLYGGEKIEDAVAALVPLAPTAFSVNCLSPHRIDAALTRLQQATALPIALYANVGRPDHERGTTLEVDVEPEEYGKFAQTWLRRGVAIVGGCCGTTPAHIRAVRQEIASRRPEAAR